MQARLICTAQYKWPPEGIYYGLVVPKVGVKLVLDRIVQYSLEESILHGMNLSKRKLAYLKCTLRE